MDSKQAAKINQFWWPLHTVLSLLSWPSSYNTVDLESASKIRSPRSERHESFLFSSESVCEGHPDKICDQIADAVLDSCLREDPFAKVAIEVAVDPGFVLVFGVIVCRVRIDVEGIVRSTLHEIGYSKAAHEINASTCKVVNRVQYHIPANSHGVETSLADKIGAGDQGIISGYATDETSTLLPATVQFSHALIGALKAARLNGSLPWLWPDAKVQVSVEYDEQGGALIPRRVDSIVVSTQHDRSLGIDEVRGELMETIIKKTIPAKYLDKGTKYHIQPNGDLGVVPSGKFAGVTGRKVAVDTYGGWGAHGGGAFSGKDFRQVDRSAAYLARWIAKSLVDSRLARRCLVQLSYAIGIAEPLSVYINTYGTSAMTSAQLARVVSDNFDMHPAAIARDLRLTEPIFYRTAKNGHFTNQSYPWEIPKVLKF